MNTLSSNGNGLPSRPRPNLSNNNNSQNTSPFDSFSDAVDVDIHRRGLAVKVGPGPGKLGLNASLSINNGTSFNPNVSLGGNYGNYGNYKNFQQQQQQQQQHHHQQHHQDEQDDFDSKAAQTGRLLLHQNNNQLQQLQISLSPRVLANNARDSREREVRRIKQNSRKQGRYKMSNRDSSNQENVHNNKLDASQLHSSLGHNIPDMPNTSLPQISSQQYHGNSHLISGLDMPQAHLGQVGAGGSVYLAAPVGGTLKRVQLTSIANSGPQQQQQQQQQLQNQQQQQNQRYGHQQQYMQQYNMQINNTTHQGNSNSNNNSNSNSNANNQGSMPLQGNGFNTATLISQHQILASHSECHATAACTTIKGLKPGNPNWTNQDNFFIAESIHNRSDINCYGIFDGHGENGHHCSKRCRENMIGHIISSSFDMKKSFYLMQTELSNCDVDCKCSGATCVIALIVGNKVSVSNCGDSRAIIGRRGSGGSVTAIAVSIDHKPDRPEERKRILGVGGHLGCRQVLVNQPGRGPVSMPVGPCRIWYQHRGETLGLAMSRSLGDLVVHKCGCSAEPEIIDHTIEDSDMFLVIATDGVWDVMDNNQVVQLINNFISKSGGEWSAADASNAVTKYARGRWEKMSPMVDDITCIVIKLNRN